MGNNTNPKIQFACDYCGKINFEAESKYKRSKRHFCGQTCYSKFRMYELPFEEQHRYGTGHSPEERKRRIQARTALNHAIRDGKVERMPCENENCVNWPEAHHDDYSRPLDVRWLCFIHHREWHKKIYENPELLK